MRHFYRDSIGRFTSRDGQLANIASAIEAKDFTLYQAELDALNEVDAIRNYIPEVPVKNAGDAAVVNADQEVVERDRLIAEGNITEITAFIDERTSREEFTTLLDERDATRARAKELKAEYDFLVANADKHPELDYEIVRQKGLVLLETFETLQVLKNQAEEYKNVTAPAVARLSELTEEAERANGTYNEYDQQTLGVLVRTGDFESGSREWLEQRQLGVGGSDVGKIIGTYKEYAVRDYQEVLESKILPITDEEVEAQADGHTGFAGATGRGNAWEEAIAFKFAQNNPDANVTHCKGSWQNSEHPEQKVNFDGLMADGNGNIDGVLEIKTASDASKWGDTATGLDGVPSGYRAQVLHYAHNGGFKRGAVAVMIDDKEYREYHFTMTDELKAEAQSNFEKTQKFWSEVEARKAGTYVPPESTRARRDGFSKTALNSGISGEKEKIFQEAAIFTEQPIETVKARYQELVPVEDRKDPDKVRAGLRKLYTEPNPAGLKKKIIAIDLETSGSQPTKGRIIEVGVSVRAPQGGEEDKFSRLYGLSKKSLSATGTGLEEIHHITPGMVAKKARFEQTVPQQELLTLLKSGVVEAHNAQFEKKWLRLHLAGFAEAERNGEIQWLDTMTLSKRLLPETENNTLNSFVEHFGIPYDNAHRAYFDARMMAEGAEKLRAQEFAKSQP